MLKKLKLNIFYPFDFYSDERLGIIFVRKVTLYS